MYILQMPRQTVSISILYFVVKNLITTYCINTIKPRARGIGDSTSGDSDQSFIKWKLQLQLLSLLSFLLELFFPLYFSSYNENECILFNFFFT